MAKHLTITGHSTALFSTWYYVREYAALFDCGDGVTAALMQSARRIKHVFISHADRDHLAGLMRFLQLNGREELSIYYPRDCGSFPALAEFSAKFDPGSKGTKWVPLDRNQEVQIRQDLIVRAVENRHVETAGRQVKSLSYFIDEVSRKLKPEYAVLPGTEIAGLRKERGNTAITNEIRTPQFAFSA
ncbi:MAG: MBL fold metallo-hydrolase, partial [Planctomycetaceae bacterium]